LRDPVSMPAQVRADGRLNLLRALCHPDGLRPYIQNWPTVAGWLIERVHREAVVDGQSDTTMALLREVLAEDDRVLQFLTTITTFGTLHDITLLELRVECFFPADEATERMFQTWIHHRARRASPEPPKGAEAESARRARMTPRKQPSRV